MRVRLSWPVVTADPNLREWRIYGNPDRDVDVKGRFLTSVPASETTAEVEVDEGWWAFRILGVARSETETPWETAEARISGTWTARGAGHVPADPVNVGLAVLGDGMLHGVIDPPVQTVRPYRVQVIGGPPTGISDAGLGHLIGEWSPRPAGPDGADDQGAQHSPALVLGGFSRSSSLYAWVRPISVEGTPGTAVLRSIRPAERGEFDAEVVASVDMAAGTYSGFPAPATSDGHEASATYGFRARAIPKWGSADWADGWGDWGGTGLFSQLRAVGRFMDNGSIVSSEIDLGASAYFGLDLYHEAHRRDSAWTTKALREFNLYPAIPHEHRRSKNTPNSAAWTMREMLWGGVPRQPLRDVWWEYVSTTTATLSYVEADWKRAIPGQFLEARKFKVRLRWFEPLPLFRFSTGSIQVSVLRPLARSSGAGSPEGVVYAGRGAFYRQTSTPNVLWWKTTQSGNTGWLATHSGGGSGSTPTGTGFRRVTAGVEDAAASVDFDTDGTLGANSDAKVATQKAVKTAIAAEATARDAAIAAAVTGLLDFKSATDCSANPNYPAASKGDAYVVSVAGKIGGASGTAVDVGDVFVASADNAGGTQAAVGSSWFLLEHNLAGALLAANNLSDLASAATARTNLGLGALAVKSSVATTDVDADAITYAKMQNVSATDKLLGRSTAGAGDVEEIPCTAAGRALIDDASAADQRTTLGLGGAAVLNVGTAAGTAAAGDDARFVGQLLGHTDASTDVVNNAAEATLWSASIASMAAGDRVRVRISGDYLNNSGSTRTGTLRVKFGSTTLLEVVTPTQAASATRRSWFLDYEVSAYGATNAQESGGTFQLGGISNAAVGTAILGLASTIGSLLGAPATEDTTSAKTFSVTWQHSAANASLSMRLTFASLNKLKA